MKPKENYCGKCGAMLIKQVVPAEKIKRFVPYHGFIKPFDKYNEETGERQYAEYYKCPHSRWFNNHSEYEDESQIIIVQVDEVERECTNPNHLEYYWYDGGQHYQGYDRPHSPESWHGISAGWMQCKEQNQHFMRGGELDE